MKDLTYEQLSLVNGGGELTDAYNDLKDLVMNHLRDFFEGFEDGWNSL